MATPPTVDDAAVSHDAGAPEVSSPPYTNRDPPPAPPVSCTHAPSSVGSFELGEIGDTPTVQAMDERRVLVSWHDLGTHWHALVFDVVSGSTESDTKIDTGYERVVVAPLGGGAFMARMPGNTIRIFSGVRWSMELPYPTARPAPDGRFLLVGETRDAWFDGKTGTLAEFDKPFASGDDTPLSGGRVLAVSRPASGLLAIHDGTHWLPSTPYATAQIAHAGEHVIAFTTPSASVHVPTALYAQHFDASRPSDGFGPPELVSLAPAGPASTWSYRYKSVPAATFVAVDDTLHFIGGVTTCETCAPVVVDRTLGKDGWSPPLEIPLGAASIGDVYTRTLEGRPVVTDVARQRQIVRTAMGWTAPLDFAAHGDDTLFGVRPEGIYADAAARSPDGKVTTQWIGFAAPTDTAMRWIELAPPMLAARGSSVYGPSYFETHGDVGGGIVVAGDDATGLAIARIDATPAIRMLRVLEGARLKEIATTAHSVMITSTAPSSIAEGSWNLRIDSWNDRGEGLTSNVVIPTVDSASMAAVRCGGAVAYVQAGTHDLHVYFDSGE